jgi:REP element-mobilizing transposase RayT
MSSGIFNKYTVCHNRQTIRLSGYDYSNPAYYFVTVCIHDRKQNLFGDIANIPIGTGFVWDGSVGIGSVGIGSVGACSMDGFSVGAGSMGCPPVGAGSKPAHFRPNQYAAIVKKTWFDLPNHNHNIKLDEFIVMPNHIHGIIQIVGEPPRIGSKQLAGLEPAPTAEPTRMAMPVGLPEIVRQLKTFSAKRINIECKTPGKSVWQRNYYEHIIRNKKSLYFIRKYIRENPLKWMDDSENHIDREIDYFQMTEKGEKS